MDNSPDDGQSKQSDESGYLPAKTFEGHSLTRAKKLRSPVRSNESSSAMPMPIHALIVDIEEPNTPDEDDVDDGDDGDNEEDDEYVSSSGSSTPKASRQSFGSSSLSSPPPAYVNTTGGSSWHVEHPSTPRASRQIEKGAYNSQSPTLPARAYSPPREDRYGRRHGRNESVSSMGTVRPAKKAEEAEKSTQEVLDVMINDLSRPQQQNEDRDDGVYERGLGLKPARSLRRERRKKRD